MSANIYYTGFGSGVYVIPSDGIPILVPGMPNEDKKAVENKYIKGKGKYCASQNDIIMHINKHKSTIFLVFGKRFNEAQRECLKQMMEKLGTDLTAQILSCDSSIHYEVDKFIQMYNLIVQA